MMASLEASKEEVYVPLPPSAEGSPELSGVGKDADLQDASADFKYASTPCHPGQEQYRPFAYRRPLTSLSLSTYGTVDSCLPAVRSPFIGGPSGAERPIAHADDPHAHTMDNCVPEQQSFPYIEHGKDANYDVHGGNVQEGLYQTHESKGYAGGSDARQDICQTYQRMPVFAFPGQGRADVDHQIHSASNHVSHDPNSDQQYYPAALATHNAVIRNPELFMTTLENFLAAIGFKLIIPKISGVDLNLHRFYCEVTACGGYAQVVRLGQWKEVSQGLGLHFSLSTAYVLRKHYSSLLFHYEQTYFFRTGGPLVVPPGPLLAPNPVGSTTEAICPYGAPPEALSTMKKQKRNLDAIEVFGVDPASAIGHMVTGVIDGKTEEGYFVTVVVGTEKLTGIIYHVSSDCENNQFASIPSLLDGIGSGENTGSLEVQLYNKIKKEPIRKENFVSPKRPRTAYNIFHKEQYEKLIQLYPSAKGLGKKVIEMWGRLPEDEKAAYIARSNQEREKYVMESGGSKKSRIRATGLAVDACSNETSIGESDAYCVSHDYRVSLEPENDISIDHPHIPNPDQSSLAYQPNGPPYPRHTGVIDNPFIPEQSCGIQKGDIHKQKHVPEGARDDGDSEEKCEGEEDQAVYRPKIASEENDIGVYGAPEKEAGMQESSYGFPLKQPIPPQLGPHGAYVTDNRPYFGPGHVYVYGSPVPPPQIIRSQGSFPIRSFGQTSYPMQQNGKFVYPHMNSMHSEASGNHMMIHHQQCFPHDQAAIFHRQEDVSPYPGPFYQHQGVMPGIDMQQAPLDHAYQESYSYPMHLTHSQMYGRLVMRGYPIRFPHTPYPTPWSDSQAIQYSHAYAPPMHPSQVSVTEGSAVKLDSQVDDGRCDNQA